MFATVLRRTSGFVAFFSMAVAELCINILGYDPQRSQGNLEAEGEVEHPKPKQCRTQTFWEDRVPTLNVYISLRWFCIECTLRLFLISIVTTPFCGNGLGLSGYWRKFDVLVDVFRH